MYIMNVQYTTFEFIFRRQGVKKKNRSMEHFLNRVRIKIGVQQNWDDFAIQNSENTSTKGSMYGMRNKTEIQLI